MATIASGANGNWSATGTWTGGVVPGLGDKVNITHTVTVDDTSRVGGDDTTTAININSGGILKFSRSANSTLRCRGNVVIASGGELDMGKSSDPISSYTATILINDSASLAHGKYGILKQNGGKLFMYGATRTRWTTSSSSCASGQAVINVTSATGWAAGDLISVGSSNAYTETEYKVIQSVSGTQITCTTNFTYSHSSGVYVGYGGGNVVIKNYNASYCGFVWTSGAATDHQLMEVQNTWFHNINGTYATSTGYGLSLYQALYSGTNRSIIAISNNSFTADTFPTSATFLDFGNVKFTFTCDNNVFFGNTTASSLCAYSRNGSVAAITNSCFMNAYSGIVGAWNAGLGVVRATGCKFVSCFYATSLTVSFTVTLTDCDFDACRYTELFSNTGKMLFSSCRVNKGAGTPSSTYIVSANTQNSTCDKTFDNCQFEIGGGTSIKDYLYQYQINGDPTCLIKNLNQEGSPANQEYYYPGVYLFKDNSTFSRGTSSIRMEPKLAGWQSFGIKVLALNGVATRIVGRMRYNSAYATTNKPKVTISGLGITPVSYTMTEAADTWETYTLDFTQSSGADGELDLTFEGNSANLTTGYCWFDGVPTAPFITAVRHYGYMFEPTVATRKVDPVTVKTETQANAVTGYSINDGTTTLTITGSITVRDLYDAIKADRCTNLTQLDFFRSVDGVNFTCDYNLTINGGSLTGTGTLALGTKTLTLSSGGTTTLSVTDTVASYATLTVSGLQTGSDVVVYKSSDGSVLTSVDANAGTTWAYWYGVQQNVDIGVFKAGYIPYYVRGYSLGTTNSTLLVSQVADRAYLE